MSYNPNINFREQAEFYISAKHNDIEAMLASLDLKNLKELFQHIPKEYFFDSPINIHETLSKDEIIAQANLIAKKNKIQTSFILDGLNKIHLPLISNDLLNLRELTTSYTPYQPERSQGTLISLWLYQCLMSQITGFEAINSSFYERSTAIFEALRCSDRIHKNKKKHIIISEGIFPYDQEVLKTHCAQLDYCLHWIKLDSNNGLTHKQELEKIFKNHKEEITCCIFPQINHLGLLEDVDFLCDITHEYNSLAIAIIDPLFLTNNGLKKPTEFGTKGADMFIGEAQHLACPTSFGGPGLGIFGIRYNQNSKNNIRATAGRYVGKAKDINGEDCFSLILSTREQHIKRERANSNICSNQAYIATICAGVILNLGSEGLEKITQNLQEKTLIWGNKLLQYQTELQLAFEQSQNFNEIVFQTNRPTKELIQLAQKQGISLGLDVSDRIEDKDNLLKISFSDEHTEEDFKKLSIFFDSLTSHKK